MAEQQTEWRIEWQTEWSNDGNGGNGGTAERMADGRIADYNYNL